jgi:hypothetical protein
MLSERVVRRSVLPKARQGEGRRAGNVDNVRSDGEVMRE